MQIDAENVDREWAIGIGQTLPMSTCMLRTFFDLIEGDPPPQLDSPTAYD
jgi:hypothetical protein